MHMQNVFNSRLRYLFLIPIVLAIAGSLFFSGVYGSIRDALLTEKSVTAARYIDIVGEAIDGFAEQDHDWNNYPYEPIIARLMESIDETPHVFAAAYNEDLSVISTRYVVEGDLDFDPLHEDTFEPTVRSYESGALILSYDTGHGVPLPMHLYYRWVPSGSEYEGRYLIAVGVTDESVVTHPADMLGIGVIAMIAIVFVLCVGMIWVICSLGEIYDKRKGVTKWRSTPA